MIPKAGPWYDPQFELALKKIALQSGAVTPSEVGLELDEKKSGEKPALLMTPPVAPGTKPPSSVKKGEPQSGRPTLSKDKQKRKQKTFSPKSKAFIELWAKAALEDINEIINPELLKFYNKKNLRSLTHEQTESAEMVKFGVLSNLEPMSAVTADTILANINKPINTDMVEMYGYGANELKKLLKREPTLDELRQIQIYAYSSVNGEEQDG